MKYNDLRGLLHYVPLFRGKLFVVMLEGEIIDSENFPHVLQDLAVLHSLGLKLVLVFGIRHQLKKLAEKRGVTPSSVDGVGVTDATTMELSLEVISRMSVDLLQSLTSIGLAGAVTNAVTAHPAGVIDGKELQFTGSIDKLDEHLVAKFIDQDIIPILPPVGFEKQGHMLRINGTALAKQLGIELKAMKVLLLVPDSIERQGKRVRQLTVVEARALLNEEKPKDPTEQIRNYQLRMAADAVEGGVDRVHFVDGRQDEALLAELFSFEGTGTLVYEKPYRHVREARRSDLPGIMSMLSKAVADQELVPRSPKEVAANLKEYYVLEVDDSLVGMVSIHIYPNEEMAEMGCLYVRRTHEGQGYGTELVRFAEEKARELKAKTFFALSTQAYVYFEKKFGFKQAPPTDLPPGRRMKLEKSGRNSKVLVKALV
jgi:amino-acid N-acetyltransferase